MVRSRIRAKTVSLSPGKWRPVAVINRTVSRVTRDSLSAVVVNVALKVPAILARIARPALQKLRRRRANEGEWVNKDGQFASKNMIFKTNLRLLFSVSRPPGCVPFPFSNFTCAALFVASLCGVLSRYWPRSAAGWRDWQDSSSIHSFIR